MAVLSKFDGIVIQMVVAYPFTPRFHAIYGPAELVVEINPPHIIVGDAPPNIRDKVLAWAGDHQRELLEAWDNCRHARIPTRINPL